MAAFRLAPTFIENKPGLDFGVRFMALSQTHCTGSLLGVDGCAIALAVDIEVFAPVSTSDAAPHTKYDCSNHFAIGPQKRTRE
jgi:hypothetical protein